MTTSTTNTTSGVLALSSSNRTMDDSSSNNNNTLLAAAVEIRGIEAYSTTTTLMVIIHVLFLYHWWTRKSRKRLLVSYKTLIQKKHYHKALIAILSHPPTRSSLSNNNNNNNNNEQYLAQFVPTRIRDWYNSSAFTNGRHLSGLPLLFYNAHLLWNCRALERHFYQEVALSSISTTSTIPTIPYARALWGLTLVGMTLDLGFTGYILHTVRGMNYATSASTGSTTTTTRPDVVNQVESLLCHRTMGGLTMTTCAALALFRQQFPFIPIPLFPVLPTTWLPLVSIPSISYAICISILLLLNQSVHPIASVVFGTVSGLLWSPLNLTSFLVEDYWSNGTILAYIFASLFALKANASSLVPCIDHVSWDNQGRRIYDSPESARFEQQQQQQVPDIESSNTVNNNDDTDDNNFGYTDNDVDASNHSLEEQELPLYNHNSNSNVSDTQELRHRLPIMTDILDDNNDNNNDDESEPFLGSGHARPTPTMRSRRMRPS